MDTMFENFDLWFDKYGEEDERPFMVACRDRGTMDGERWVITSLTIEEATKLHKYLEEHLHEDQQD